VPEALIQALALLATLGIHEIPEVRLAVPTPVVTAVTVTVAYVRGDEPGVIYVVRTSGAYRAALRGNPCELAAAIAHERIHVRQGHYQAPAYAEQLRVLRACGANMDSIARVAAAAAHFERDVPPKGDTPPPVD
jgi:hypothetical protein